MYDGHPWEMQGDCYMQDDCYIQVNFAENIRQLKILGSCPVTVIYRVTTICRAVIYRFDCIMSYWKINIPSLYNNNIVPILKSNEVNILTEH